MTWVFNNVLFYERDAQDDVRQIIISYDHTLDPMIWNISTVFSLPQKKTDTVDNRKTEWPKTIGTAQEHSSTAAQHVASNAVQLGWCNKYGIMYV